jgi:hypothetical protein
MCPKKRHAFHMVFRAISNTIFFFLLSPPTTDAWMRTSRDDPLGLWVLKHHNISIGTAAGCWEGATREWQKCGGGGVIEAEYKPEPQLQHPKPKVKQKATNAKRFYNDDDNAQEHIRTKSITVTKKVVDLTPKRLVLGWWTRGCMLRLHGCRSTLLHGNEGSDNGQVTPSPAEAAALAALSAARRKSKQQQKTRRSNETHHLIRSNELLLTNPAAADADVVIPDGYAAQESRGGCLRAAREVWLRRCNNVPVSGGVESAGKGVVKVGWSEVRSSKKKGKGKGKDKDKGDKGGAGSDVARAFTAATGGDVLAGKVKVQVEAIRIAEVTTGEGSHQSASPTASAGPTAGRCHMTYQRCMKHVQGAVEQMRWQYAVSDGTLIHVTTPAVVESAQVVQAAASTSSSGRGFVRCKRCFSPGCFADETGGSQGGSKCPWLNGGGSQSR